VPAIIASSSRSGRQMNPSKDPLQVDAAIVLFSVGQVKAITPIAGVTRPGRALEF
jgi:hypothetical protein